MGQLFDSISDAVRNERYIVSNHADERLRERLVQLWQVINGIENAKLITERPADKPNPSVVVEQYLADGTAIKVVWAWIELNSVAVLVTVHLFDR